MNNDLYLKTCHISIGELIKLYKNNKIDMWYSNDNFYNWNIKQKTILIESILLNIPIQKIHMVQNKNNIFNLIGNSEILATIFQFIGIYKNKNNELVKPLMLENENLPKFDKLTWENLNKKQKSDFKNFKITIILICKKTTKRRTL